jgi:hypothetical protein
MAAGEETRGKGPSEKAAAAGDGNVHGGLTATITT